MINWKETRVGDIGKVITGKTPKTSIDENYGGDIPFITPSDDMTTKYIFATNKKLTETGAQSVKNNVIPPNTICVSCIGSDLGKVVISTETSVTNQQINSIVLNENEYDLDFIYYVMTSLGKVMNHHSKTSTAVPIVNKTQFSDYTFMCPDLITQKKIGGVLASLDDKISNNRSINRNLEDQLTAIYNEWFGKYKPFNIGIGGDPGYELEDGWQIQDIYSVANIIYGAPFASKLFNTEGDGIPIVRIRDLKSQELVTYTTEQHPKGYLIQQGDIVVGMDGEFRPYIWGNDKAWLNQRVCVFDNIRENGKAYLYCTIKPLLYSVEATEVATTVIHIGKKDYDEFRVVIPPDDILNKFEMISKPMYDQIVEGQVENRRLSKLRDSLLPKLMSGELDVSELDI